MMKVGDDLKKLPERDAHIKEGIEGHWIKNNRLAPRYSGYSDSLTVSTILMLIIEAACTGVRV